MRIISGELRGRQWKVTTTTNFRPTCDRIREAIFNILDTTVQNVAVGDVFCGMGGFGLEALSRGARRAYWIDSDRRAMSDLKQVISDWGISDRGRVLVGPAEKMLKRLPAPVQILFADPPFFYDNWPQLLRVAADPRAVADDGLFIAEVSSRENFVAGPLWRVEDERHYGDARVWFMRKNRALVDYPDAESAVADDGNG
ncbi:MAG TPA: RsmD family RNA methyltransferase [bacterium]|nr:RsmD family RNA methyltransferase [bacterium]